MWSLPILKSSECHMLFEVVTLRVNSSVHEKAQITPSRIQGKCHAITFKISISPDIGYMGQQAAIGEMAQIGGTINHCHHGLIMEEMASGASREGQTITDCYGFKKQMARTWAAITMDTRIDLMPFLALWTRMTASTDIEFSVVSFKNLVKFHGQAGLTTLIVPLFLSSQPTITL